jgi:hypothetical protein
MLFAARTFRVGSGTGRGGHAGRPVGCRAFCAYGPAFGTVKMSASP